jgi:hypothetical protein
LHRSVVLRDLARGKEWSLALARRLPLFSLNGSSHRQELSQQLTTMSMDELSRSPDTPSEPRKRC